MGNREGCPFWTACNNGHRIRVGPLAKRAKTLLFRKPPITGILCVGSRYGKGCDDHRRGQYARHLKWPSGPPQTSPHSHPRESGGSTLRKRPYYSRSRPTRLLTLGPAIYFAGVDPPVPHTDTQAFSTNWARM